MEFFFRNFWIINIINNNISDTSLPWLYLNSTRELCMTPKLDLHNQNIRMDIRLKNYYIIIFCNLQLLNDDKDNSRFI